MSDGQYEEKTRRDGRKGEGGIQSREGQEEMFKEDREDIKIRKEEAN